MTQRKYIHWLLLSTILFYKMSDSVLKLHLEEAAIHNSSLGKYLEIGIFSTESHNPQKNQCIFIL